MAPPRLPLLVLLSVVAASSSRDGCNQDPVLKAAAEQAVSHQIQDYFTALSNLATTGNSLDGQLRKAACKGFSPSEQQQIHFSIQLWTTSVEDKLASIASFRDDLAAAYGELFAALKPQTPATTASTIAGPLTLLVVHAGPSDVENASLGRPCGMCGYGTQASHNWLSAVKGPGAWCWLRVPKRQTLTSCCVLLSVALRGPR